MLQIRRDQLLTLQASIDPPVVEHYVDTFREDAVDLGIQEAELRERVTRGVTVGRGLDARKGYELSAVVALSTLFDPEWETLPDCIDVLDLERLSLEAKLRIILSKLMQGPPEDGA